MSKLANTVTFKYFDIIMMFFASILLISNLGATKLVQFGPILTDGGAILFPLIYIFGDILTEVYGFKYSRRAIWGGFAVMLLASISFFIVGQLPSAPGWTGNEAYQSVLGFFPRIVLASLVAYLCGEFINSYVLAKLKIKLAGKNMGLRFIGSTFVGQFFDTTIFGLVAFGGILGFKDMVIYILVGWFFKTAVEIILLPVTLRVVKALKKAEASDAYDTDTHFTPFSLSVKR